MSWVGVLVLSFALYLLAGPGGFPPPGQVLYYRLFRGLFAMLAGSYLSISGLLLQTVFQNPLVEPYILGVSAGASTGALIAIYIFALSSLYLISLSSFIFALLCVGFVYFLARKLHPSKETLLLVGLSTGAFLTALNSIIMLLKSENPSADLIFWLLGSLSGAGPREVLVLLLALPFMVFPLMRPAHLDLLLWDREAETMGLNYRRTQAWVLFFATFLAAAVVSLAGVIGFVGLISPHIGRRIWGWSHKKLLPGAMLTGAAVLMLSDFLSRALLSPWEIPVGLITALVGAPLFLYLTLRGSQ